MVTSMLENFSTEQLETINSFGSHMDSAVKGEYRYPHTIVLLPGISCMYKCTFCGRNYDAAFKNDEKYYHVFKDIIYQNKGRATINIGGGLEPLTSPYFDLICRDLLDVGMKSRLITNGYMMTPKYLKKNPYVEQLDTIRISLYGVDEKEYTTTTRNPKGFDMVKNNLTSMKRKVKLNWVLLPSNYYKLPLILDYINDIGGVEELSLREDWSAQYPIEDRKKFTDVLHKFSDLANKQGVNVHYGYSMYDLMNGRETKLTRCKLKHLDSKQSPQTKVYIDPKGDIYCYTGAAFLDRPGSDRHILGNCYQSTIDDALKNMKEIEPQEGDLKYMDALSHLIETYKWSIRNV